MSTDTARSDPKYDNPPRPEIPFGVIQRVHHKRLLDIIYESTRGCRCSGNFLGKVQSGSVRLFGPVAKEVSRRVGLSSATLGIIEREWWEMTAEEHHNPHPKANRVAMVIESGEPFRVEDWADRVMGDGRLWMLDEGNPAVLNYLLRFGVCLGGVVYGKVGGMGVLMYVDELDFEASERIKGVDNSCG